MSKVYVILKGCWLDPTSEDEIHGVVSSEDVAAKEVERLNEEASRVFAEYRRCESVECRQRVGSHECYYYHFVYEGVTVDTCLGKEE